MQRVGELTFILNDLAIVSQLSRVSMLASTVVSITETHSQTLASKNKNYQLSRVSMRIMLDLVVSFTETPLFNFLQYLTIHT